MSESSNPQISLIESEEERQIATAIESEEWDIAVELYEERAGKSRDPKLIGNAYKAMAHITLRKLKNKERARIYYELAREQQKGDPEVLEPLSELYLDAGKYEDARTALERLVKTRDPRENPRDIALLAEDYRRLGKVALRLNENPKALGYFRDAWEHEPEHKETLEQLADLAFQQRDLTQADTFEKALLYHHRENLSEERLAEILTRAGMRRLEAGQRPLALLKLLTALEVAPQQRGPREAVVQLYAKESSWPDVLLHRKALNDILTSGPDRAQNFKEIGELYLHQIKDEDRAIEAFREALRASPGDKNVLTYLKRFYSERGDWNEVAKLSEQLCELGKTPREKGELYEELAKLHAEKRRDKRAAVLALHKTLDADRSQTRAFDLLNQYLVDLQDLAGLEESFRRMISRVGSEAPRPIQLALLMGLGNVCRQAGRRQEAADAFEQAARIDPQDPKYRGFLADIYREDSATVPKAIEQHRILLQMEPNRPASLHALFELYRNTEPDRAYLIAGVLQFLGGPKEEEATFYQDRKASLRRARAKLSEDLWSRYLSHPQEDAFLTTFFRSIGPLLAQLYAVAPKEKNLKRDRLDIAKNGDLVFVNTFKYICDTLEINEYPELHVPKGTQKLELPPTLPLTVVIGKDNLTGVTGQELSFLLGKSLSYLRPSYLLLHQIQGVMPELSQQLSELRMVYYACLRAADPSFPIPSTEEPRVMAFLPRLKRVKEFQGDTLRNIGDFISRKKQEAQSADVVRWVAHAELATNRLGFVLSGELKAAANMIEADPRVGQMTPKERIQDLVTYSYGEQHARLRDALGLKVG